MAYLKEQDQHEMIDELINDADNNEVGFFLGFYNILRKITLSNLVKGFFGGLGGFFGSLFCYYYVLPKLRLQEYSKFLDTVVKNTK